ncbi:iron complex outermembrane receptor protein [Novosphingobium capsulatum]|uniref:Iron complex outermembrane receptor protein n=1 Tax=Novosphingobium capsulatum TaxID=13688 RepID=A0ABU1MMJ4_9SPHN|nr:TonB-dependent receptor [Novosphingobium capsulatum]MDR6511561.1 iron complex outermembrane receptor protein [Novosphingobium capsulatum]
MASRIFWAAGACTFSIAVAGTPVQAQTTSQIAGEKAPSASAATTDEIIVTARKRAENVQNVPISITAVSGATIQNQGVTNLKDFSNFVPGVSINNGRPDGGGTTAQIFIRGVGQNDFLMPNEPGVGLYVDDVYVASSVGAVDSLGDTQSVEVLRGPQGTLYGKNTIGGAIRITTVKPDFNALSGSASITGGSYGRIDLKAGINIPLGDTLALRISGASRHTDDLQKRYLSADGDGQGNINQDAIRGVLRWQPSTRFELTVAADYTRIRQHQPYGGNIGYVSGASPLVDALNAQYYPTINAQLGLPANAQFDSRWATAPNAVGATGPNSDHYDVWGASAVASYELGADITLKSITALRGVKGFAGRDGDSSPYPLVETTSYDNNTQFSQELQLNGSSFENRLKWTTGLYYMNQTLHNNIVANLWHGLVDTTVNIDFDARSRGRLKGQSYAVFGQGTFDITDALHLTAGGRYNIEKRDFQNDWYFLVQPRSYRCPGTDVTGQFIQCKSTDKVFTPMVSLAYDVTRSAMVYASYSDGFKVGGWTPRLFSQQSLKRYQPERLKAYELGIKTTWFDHRLTFNIDVFQSDYTNLQLTSVQADSTGAPQPVVQNAGAARIRGIESELSARIGQGTRIQAGLSYLDGKYRRLDPSVSFPLTAQLPETPKLSLTGSIEQSVHMPAGDVLTARVDGSYRSKTYKDPNNVEAIAQRPYALLNARISYTVPSGKVTFAAFGTNLTDKRYLVSGLDIASTFGIYEAYFGRPREFGGEIAVKF